MRPIPIQPIFNEFAAMKRLLQISARALVTRKAAAATVRKSWQECTNGGAMRLSAHIAPH
jgi:hypothetical protein